MVTLAPLLPQPYFSYYGERGDWLVALGQHRDSDALERSNWDVISTDLLTRFPDDVAIERFHNWAVGWTESLLVRPGTPAADEAQRWDDRLREYPVADEDAYGMLEVDEEWCVRCDGATRADHPTSTCHKFRSEEDGYEIVYAWKHRRDFR